MLKYIFLLSTIIILLFNCTPVVTDLSGIYIVDEWEQSILFSIGKFGYEVKKNDKGYTFTLIGLEGDQIIGKKETRQAIVENDSISFEMIPPRDTELGFSLLGVSLMLYPNDTGLQGYVMMGQDESYPIHFRKLK